MRAHAFIRVLAMLAICFEAARPTGRADAQRASLVGMVLSDSAERPVLNAEIAIAALGLSARSDSAGGFSLLRIAAGRYEVVVRAVGSVPYHETIVFGEGDKIERDILLKRSINALASVSISASLSMIDVRMAGFEERRKMGMGRFITQAELEKAGGRQLGNFLVSKLGGVRAASMGGGQNAIASARGVSSFSKVPSGDLSDVKRGAKPECYVQIIVDDIIWYRGQVGEKLVDINSFLPEYVAGIEYYTTSTTPSRFVGTACGTLIIWTRMRQ